jgi:hypothetical protein
MATYSSVLLGSCSGAIGNVVTRKSKRQNIVQSAPAKGRKLSPAMQAQQKKLMNSYKAYSYLKNGLKGFYKLRKQKENIYNCFVRITQGQFSTDSVEFSYQAANMLSAFSYFVDNRITIRSLDVIFGILMVDFNYIRGQQHSRTYLSVLAWNSQSQGNIFVEKHLEFYEWESKHIEIGLNEFNADSFLVYFYTKKRTFTSTIQVFTI